MQPKMILVLALCGIWVAGCATRPSDSEAERAAAQMLKTSFKSRGQATIDRLNQDETQRVCSELAGKAPAKEVAEKIEKLNLATIRYPADGKLLGDWKNGEKIAQEGRGKQFSDDAAGPVGANCYACHQLTPQELQVALLLANGRTTREAAASLFVSPQSVEYHLRHVYAKLGIHSRDELSSSFHKVERLG